MLNKLTPILYKSLPNTIISFVDLVLNIAFSSATVIHSKTRGTVAGMKTLFKPLRLPEQIPCDKRMHFMIGVLYTAILTIFTLNLFIVIPFLVVLSYGIEYGQKWIKSGHFDHWDAIAVILGGLTVLAPYLIKG